MFTYVLPFLFLVFTAFVHGQDQSGFISIDCGIPENSSYADRTTGIFYVSDAKYIETGVSKTISPQYQTNELPQQFLHVRSFPQGDKNCYILKPPQFKDRHRYFIRARFLYGNYDDKNEIPKFDIYLGVNYWLTVEFSGALPANVYEILHVPTSNYTYFCLVNTGLGTPFISVLELRLVDDDIYVTDSGSLEVFNRYDIRSSDNKVNIRYGDDIFDRIWRPSFLTTGVSEISTSLTIGKNSYKLPPVVMGTAITMQNASDPIEFYWYPPDPKAKYFIFMHFADFQFNQSREFHIFLNKLDWYGPLKPPYLSTTTIRSVSPESPATQVNFSLIKTANSTLPPLLNALEVYILRNFPDQESDQEDVTAIKDIKATYGVTKNWQGDPCLPTAYSWEGLNCTKHNIDPPRISSLNLHFSGLTGNISTSIFNLKMLKFLDLSNNSLTGSVPDFLGLMEKLSVLKLDGNNFTGTLPAKLLERSKSGLLALSVEGNPNLCKSETCDNKPIENSKKKNLLVPIVSSVAAVSVLIAFGILCMFILRRKKPSQEQGAKVESMPTEVVTKSNEGEAPYKAKQQQFSYSDVISITGNFRTMFGKGGSGTVYQGYLEDTQVAVKMISPSSTRDYTQFKAEAELLVRFHHRNLTALIGYCDEGEKLGLIYEYMAEGDLRSHLSDRNRSFLSWQKRLEIALDAAQGLEYLHTGCRPPIIHKDVKSTNILLNDEFQAKLTDFGLSKVSPIDLKFNLNENSDVFSFGVVLLEIITGRPAIARTKEMTHIREWVSDIIKTKGDVRNVVDPRLGRDFDINSAWKVVDVAMECLSDVSTTRHTMDHVVIELKRCLNMEKTRMNGNSQAESNYDSNELSFLNISDSGMAPKAR